MNVECNPHSKQKKWYNSYKFPLVPVFTKKEGSEHNTKGFTFEWLIFKIWTLDNFSFELGITCSEHWGIGVIAILPYLRVVACVPCPEKLGTLVDRLLSRKPNAC